MHAFEEPLPPLCVLPLHVLSNLHCTDSRLQRRLFVQRRLLSLGPAMPRKMTLKVAARTVQTTVHMERKLTKKREGLREGRHLALPPGLPQGPPPTAEEPPEPGRLALRRVRQAQLEA